MLSLCLALRSIRAGETRQNGYGQSSANGLVSRHIDNVSKEKRHQITEARDRTLKTQDYNVNKTHNNTR